MPSTAWWVHRFVNVTNATYVVNHVASMIGEDCRRPNNSTGYGSITQAEAALGGIGIENGSPWYIHRSGNAGAADCYFIVDHSSAQSYKIVCPSSPPGYSTIKQLADQKKLSKLESTGNCSS